MLTSLNSKDPTQVNAKLVAYLQISHFQKREASKLYILFQIHVLNSVSFEDYKNFDN